MAETPIVSSILKLLSRRGRGRLYRNNTRVLRVGGRLMRFGLCPGSSDIIGFESVKITEDMVGGRLARFVALEVKDAKGKVTDKQMDFIQDVIDAGGKGAVVRSVEDALKALEGKDV